MTLRQQLIVTDAPVVADLTGYLTTTGLSEAGWNNAPTWDNLPAQPWNNQPTWDNWNQK